MVEKYLTAFFLNTSSSMDSIEESANIVKETISRLTDWLIGKAGSVLIALVFLLIGIKISNLFLKFLSKSFEKSKMEPSVAGFLASVIRVLLYVLVFITAATIVGFEVTSFVTILGTASLAVGLALQGALSNLAGGVLILLLKPFQIGDYIVENNNGNEGTVASIDIFYTRLKTHDNRIIVIPNGILANNSLVNLTNEEKRKIEIKISISYKSDMNKVKEVVNEMLLTDPDILQEDPFDVFIDSFNDSGMTLGIRAYVKTADYWPVTWRLRERLKEDFDRNEIIIPYNHLEVDISDRR